VVSYFYFKFHILDRFILEEYVFQVEGGPHMFQSCLRVVQNGLLPVTREMHPFFESLAVTGTPSLQTSLMDIHHNTSLKSILEYDSISSTSKTYICFHLDKGARLWLVTKPFIYSFCITQSTFTSTLHFYLNLIQPSAFNFLMYENGHKLNTSSTHLVHCPF
jgi:hypothetical protein